MKDFEIILAAITSVILFVFSLEHFSKELQRISGESFRKFLASATKLPIIGLLLGAIITSIIQSSSATSVIAISLVNAGVLSFKNSIGVIFGANVGTTITAQLIAFKLTSFAPFFIILGFILSLLKNKASVFGKSLFYFGFVFFTLNLISSTLSPLQSDPRTVEFLTAQHNPLYSVFIGLLVTVLVQSSSVTTGLAVVFTQQGLMSLDNALPILIGANMGTTVTALIAIVNMDIAAKKTALAHAFFNVGGALIFIPMLFFGKKYLILSDDPAIALANFHLVFNLSTSFLFLIFINPFANMIDNILGDGNMDFERIDFSHIKESTNLDDVVDELMANETKLFNFIQENYNLVTMSIETNFKSIYETSLKRIDYVDYIRQELLVVISKVFGEKSSDESLPQYIQILDRYEYLFQLHDSIKDLVNINNAMKSEFIEIKSDVLYCLRELTSHFLTFFRETQDAIDKQMPKEQFKEISRVLKVEINSYQNSILRLMRDENRKDARSLYHMVTYSQRIRDKLINYYKVRIENIAS